jgi:hypothetical protein
MEMVSSVFEAFGIIEFDALNDLAGWLDGPAAPAASVDGRSGDQGPHSVGPSAGWEI